jgi:hypothetical protein
VPKDVESNEKVQEGGTDKSEYVYDRLLHRRYFFYGWMAFVLFGRDYPMSGTPLSILEDGDAFLTQYNEGLGQSYNADNQ